jgi:hypothetical protein
MPTIDELRDEAVHERAIENILLLLKSESSSVECAPLGNISPEEFLAHIRSIERLSADDAKKILADFA